MFRRRPTPPRVLIVDDEPSVTVYLDRLLSANGCTTVAVNRGAEAQAVLERGDRFDVAVLDLVMPDMTGDEVARLFRLAHPDGKVLFVTGYADALFQVRPVLWADEAFLEKPFTGEAVLEAISLLLNGHIGPLNRVTALPKPRPPADQ
jgi:two-component system cell cycle sensor histidine kinase/response regulator CckA